MKKKVILISGFKGAGKDYVANQIHDELIDEHKVKVASFATPIKKIAATLLETDLETLDKAKNEHWDITLNGYVTTDARLLLQRLGNEAIKPIFGDAVWADLMLKNIVTSTVEYFVIPDFRFMIEYEELSKHLDKDQFELITIRVEDNDRVNTDLHASETELLNNDFKFDYILDNTGKTSGIKVAVVRLVKIMKEQ